MKLILLFIFLPFWCFSQYPLDGCGNPKTVYYESYDIDSIAINIHGVVEFINQVSIRKRIDGSESIEFWYSNPTVLYAEIPFIENLKKFNNNLLCKKHCQKNIFWIIDFDEFLKFFRGIKKPTRV